MPFVPGHLHPTRKVRQISGMALQNLNEPLPSRMLSDFPVANLLHFAELRLITFEEVVDRARHGLLMASAFKPRTAKET